MAPIFLLDSIDLGLSAIYELSHSRCRVLTNTSSLFPILFFFFFFSRPWLFPGCFSLHPKGKILDRRGCVLPLSTHPSLERHPSWFESVQRHRLLLTLPSRCSCHTISARLTLLLAMIGQAAQVLTNQSTPSPDHRLVRENHVTGARPMRWSSRTRLRWPGDFDRILKDAREFKLARPGPPCSVSLSENEVSWHGKRWILGNIWALDAVLRVTRLHLAFSLHAPRFIIYEFWAVFLPFLTKRVSELDT